MATVVFVLNFCGLPRRALAAPTPAPTQNFTALRTDIAPPWVPDPDNRGTWSLLYSCVFTLVLCVWTAIHLNVPSYHESQISQWLRKMKWVLLAIIAPELGVYTALEQYHQATKLIRQLAEISVKNGSQSSTDQSDTQLPRKSQESDPEKAATERRVFSLIYGYYAIMGGLAVDVNDIDDQLHSVTLTPAGLKLLAERGHFIEVSDGDIRDKSKADIFAKCLVILQVTWISLQTISRKATGYPLSPLEIHTLVHAACASVMYILWFHKPLDVQAPTIVSNVGFEDLTALMLTQTPRFGTTWYSHFDPPKDFKPSQKGPRSEASFLLFDFSALSRRDEGCPSCREHFAPSTTTDEEVADKDALPAIAKTCGNCANLSNSERQQAETSEVRTLSSPITSHPPTGIRCVPPPGVKAVCELRSGEFTPEGIGLQPLITGPSYHDLYFPKERYRYLPRFLYFWSSKPALPAQISSALKARLPEPFAADYKPAYWHEISLSLSEKNHKRWKLAGAAFLKEMEIQGVSDPGNGRYRSFEMARTIGGWPRYEPLLAWRSHNMDGEFLFPSTTKEISDSGRLLLTLWLLASLYGGIHLALWSYEFPTPEECLLWRISAATLASVPILCVLLLLYLVTKDVSTDWLQKIFPRFCSAVRTMWWSWAKNMLGVGVVWTFSLAFCLAAILYTFARIFIVVESFISLRHVPIGVYEGGLGWSKYIPHL